MFILKRLLCKQFRSIDYFKIRPTARYLGTDSLGVNKNVLSSQYGVITDENVTLTQHIFDEAVKWADETAITCAASGRSYKYGTMQMMIERCAKALISELKLSPGETIGLILPNIPEFLVMAHGALMAGLVLTFANPLYSPDEILRQFAQCNVKAISTIEMFMPVAMEVSKSLKGYKGTIAVDCDGDKIKEVYGLRSLLMENHKVDLPTINPDNVCLIPYSSGTSGLPKGVMLTHRNLVSSMKQVCQTEFMKHKGKKGSGEVVLAIPPFFHIYGFNMSLNYCIYVRYHLISIPQFSPEKFIEALIKYKPTGIFVVPSVLVFLAGHPAVKREYLETISTISVGGAPATSAILDKLLKKSGKNKDELALLQGYGMTETSLSIIVTPYFYPYEKVGSIGQIVPSTQIKVVSLTTGEALGPNQPGELLVRGPQVMKGYLNNDAATKETIDSEGWLHTGDVVYYDKDEFFYIVDRTKELIKTKGFQISPTEIETIIIQNLEVADVAVIGIPDEQDGEVPKAFVVCKQNHQITKKQIYDIVAEKLVKYKHLKGGVEFIDAIPRNVAGKIMRNELKALIKNHKITKQ